MNADAAIMGAALALAERGVGLTGDNPSVGCVILDARGKVAGRGWTQPGGRPHAEAMALAAAGSAASGGSAFVTLEPCAHISERGPACAQILIAAGVARVIIAHPDPDPRTNGKGVALLRAAGIDVEEGVETTRAAWPIAGFLMRQREGRPHVTLKLAVSLDGCIALPDGRSRWITGEAARAHVHLERARADMILIGRGTYTADAPRLDVRLPGLEQRAPARAMLTRGAPPPGWQGLRRPEEVAALPGQRLLVEGGASAAAAFLAADLVDRLLIYRAPILIGSGQAAIGDIGLDMLADAHGRWRARDSRMLGSDRLDVYERARG